MVGALALRMALSSWDTFQLLIPVDGDLVEAVFVFCACAAVPSSSSKKSRLRIFVFIIKSPLFADGCGFFAVEPGSIIMPGFRFLAEGFVQAHRAGNADVQRLDHT